MKKDKHPQYQQVLFVDSTTGTRFVIGSTLQPKAKEKFEGKEYPVYPLSTSSYSHPFFTGQNKFVDAEGRVDRFKKRYERKSSGEGSSKEESSEQGSQEKPKKGSKGSKSA